MQMQCVYYEMRIEHVNIIWINFMLQMVNVLFSVPELSKSLIGFEFGTSRDAERTKLILENMTMLTPLVHG
jgi:hypothetical protein